MLWYYEAWEFHCLRPKRKALLPAILSLHLASTKATSIQEPITLRVCRLVAVRDPMETRHGWVNELN